MGGPQFLTTKADILITSSQLVQVEVFFFFVQVETNLLNCRIVTLARCDSFLPLEIKASQPGLSKREVKKWRAFEQ